MEFYKYRHKFSSGPAAWMYREGSIHEDLAEELKEEYNWSEHYRGVEIEPWTPTEEWLNNHIHGINQQIKFLTIHRDTLKEFKNDLYVGA